VNLIKRVEGHWRKNLQITCQEKEKKEGKRGGSAKRICCKRKGRGMLRILTGGAGNEVRDELVVDKPVCLRNQS